MQLARDALPLVFFNLVKPYCNIAGDLFLLARFLRMEGLGRVSDEKLLKDG